MQFYVEMFVVFMGLVATAYPLSNGVTFFYTNELGRACAINYFCESFGMLITTVFAILALIGVLTELHYLIYAALRLGILGPTIYGSRQLRRVACQHVKPNEC